MQLKRRRLEIECARIGRIERQLHLVCDGRRNGYNCVGTLSDNRTVMVPADDAFDLPVAGDN